MQLCRVNTPDGLSRKFYSAEIVGHTFTRFELMMYVRVDLKLQEVTSGGKIAIISTSFNIHQDAVIRSDEELITDH